MKKPKKKPEKQPLLLEKLTKWLESLSEHDRNNFLVMIRLPNAAEIISRCPDPTMQEMAKIAIALNFVLGGK